jgi:hypothetical protein
MFINNQISKLLGLIYNRNNMQVIEIKNKATSNSKLKYFNYTTNQDNNEIRVTNYTYNVKENDKYSYMPLMTMKYLTFSL